MQYKMPDIQMLAILVVLTNLSMLLFPLGLIMLPELWPWFLGTWFAKTTADFILLYRITGYTQQRGSMWMFLPVSLVYYPVFLLIIISLMTRRPAWKGQHIS